MTHILSYKDGERNIVNFEAISNDSIYRMTTFTAAQRDSLMMRLYDSSFKGAVLRPLTTILYYNQLSYKNKKPIYHICKEPFMSLPVVIYVKKNFYLTKAINRKIGIFQAAGLIEYWNSQGLDKEFLMAQAFHVETFPEKLTVDHLTGCFILLSGGLIVAITVFTFEIAVKFVRRKFTKIDLPFCN